MDSTDSFVALDSLDNFVGNSQSTQSFATMVSLLDLVGSTQGTQSFATLVLVAGIESTDSVVTLGTFESLVRPLAFLLTVLVDHKEIVERF